MMICSWLHSLKGWSILNYRGDSVPKATAAAPVMVTFVAAADVVEVLVNAVVPVIPRVVTEAFAVNAATLFAAVLEMTFRVVAPVPVTVNAVGEPEPWYPASVRFRVVSAFAAAQVIVPAAVAAPEVVARDRLIMPAALVIVLPPIAVASSTRKLVRPEIDEASRATSPGLIMDTVSIPVSVAPAIAVASAVAEPEETRKVSVPAPALMESPAFKVAPVPITTINVSFPAEPILVSTPVVSVKTKHLGNSIVFNELGQFCVSRFDLTHRPPTLGRYASRRVPT